MCTHTHTHTHTHTRITESPCCTLETNTTLTKLQFLKKGKEIKRINQSQCSEEGKKRLKNGIHNMIPVWGKKIRYSFITTDQHRE